MFECQCLGGCTAGNRPGIPCQSRRQFPWRLESPYCDWCHPALRDRLRLLVMAIMGLREG